MFLSLIFLWHLSTHHCLLQGFNFLWHPKPVYGSLLFAVLAQFLCPGDKVRERQCDSFLTSTWRTCQWLHSCQPMREQDLECGFSHSWDGVHSQSWNGFFYPHWSVPSSDPKVTASADAPSWRGTEMQGVSWHVADLQSSLSKWVRHTF